jgi:hypothetical protein
MLLPLLAQVLLTFFVGLLARLRRDKAVREGFNWRYFKTFEGELPPRYVLQSDQHFTNLFEAPMLFFAVGIISISLDTVDQILLILAVLYVIFRCIHARISLTNNRLLWRGRSFIISCSLLLVMWIWIIYLNF